MYSRAQRFSTKIIGGLLRTSPTPVINAELVNKVRNCLEPEDVISAISSWKPPPGIRRPYIHATYYWTMAGGTLPIIDQNEIRALVNAFDDIFFAWHRLNIKGPSFPYIWLLRALVDNNVGGPYSEELQFLIRFTRKMRCENRLKRYSRLFDKCLTYVENEPRNQTKIPQKYHFAVNSYNLQISEN